MIWGKEKKCRVFSLEFFFVWKSPNTLDQKRIKEVWCYCLISWISDCGLKKCLNLQCKPELMIECIKLDTRVSDESYQEFVFFIFLENLSFRGLKYSTKDRKMYTSSAFYILGNCIAEWKKWTLPLEISSKRYTCS